jgi:hypothetical protein
VAAPGAPERTEIGPPLAERLTFAARQAATVTIVLLVLRALTRSSNLAATSERDLVSAPFLWAVVAWAALLLFNALAFELSQMRRVESRPLLFAGLVAAVFFVVGLTLQDQGSTADRLVFLLLNSLGVLLFWWALFGLAYLLWVKI